MYLHSAACPRLMNLSQNVHPPTPTIWYDMYPTAFIIQVAPGRRGSDPPRLLVTSIWVVHSLSKWTQLSTLVRNSPGTGSTSTFHMQCFLFFILKKVHVVHFRVYNVTSICKDNSWYINWITNIVHILILLDCYDYGSATSYRIDCLHVCCPISVK